MEVEIPSWLHLQKCDLLRNFFDVLLEGSTIYHIHNTPVNDKMPW